VQLVDAALYDEESGLRVARARALRIRWAEVQLPTGDPYDRLLATVQPPPGPAGIRAERSNWGGDLHAFHYDGAEHRFVVGSWAELGPVTVWVRLRVPVVHGEEPTPWQRAASAADFGNGVSFVLPYDDYTFVNPDLTINLVRQPTGEWVCLQSSSTVAGEGVGLARSDLFDERGLIGTASQSLVIDRRPV
jgi:hypothetical protein